MSDMWTGRDELLRTFRTCRAAFTSLQSIFAVKHDKTTEKYVYKMQ